MANIFVVPETLANAGADLARSSAGIESVAAQVRSAAAGSGACGFPDAAQALEAFGDRWGEALSRTSAGVAGLGGAVKLAGDLYSLTDELAILLP
jgi:hypothetical protein